MAFKELTEHLATKKQIILEVLDDNGVRGRGLANVVRGIQLVFNIVRGSLSADVVTLHCNPTSLHIMGSIVVSIALFLRKKTIIRKFAGDDYLSRLGGWRGRLADWTVRRADLYLVETKRLLSLTQSRGHSNVKWFPNHRHVGVKEPVRRRGDRVKSQWRFVYVGHIRAYKGIEVLVCASRNLPKHASIDLYGPIYDDFDPSLLNESPRLFYKGTLNPDEVTSVLRNYDVFVMPTVAVTEGYPGAILEAFSVGLPVVTSRIGAIDEIVDEKVGILVEPNNPEELLCGLNAFIRDPILHQEMSTNAHCKALSYSTAYWGDIFLGFCIDLREKRTSL